MTFCAVFVFAEFCYLKKKEFVIILFCGLVYYMYRSSNCHSVEHFAIASAGFFVLLASFAVQRKK